MKLKCILLALLLAVSVYSVPSLFAYAEDTDHNIEILSQLGIDEGINTDSEAYITRAEFAAMAVRILNLDNLSKADGSFDDVSEGDLFADEIYTAKALRMTSGTSEGIFSPDGMVELAAAQKMLLTAMGYETYANALGGYPTGYTMLSQRVGITKGLSVGTALTVADAKYMVYNALKADVATFSGIENGELITTTQDGVNLLTESFDLSLAEGVVKQVSYMSTSTNFDSDDVIKIGNLSLKLGFDATGYFGKKVEAWYDKTDKILYAIEVTHDNKEVILSAEEVSAYSDYKLTSCDENGKTKTYNMEKSFIFIENGRPVGVTKDSFTFPEGTLRLIDNNSNGKYDYAIAEKTEYFVVDTVSTSSKTVFDPKSEVKSVCIDGDDSVYYKLYDIDGSELDIKSVKKNDVFRLIASNDNKVKVGRRIEVDKIEGTADEISSVTIKINSVDTVVPDSIYVGGTAYKTSMRFKKNYAYTDAGKEYSFIVADNLIIGMGSAGESSMKYGYYLDFGEDSGLGAERMLKVLADDGEKKILTLADSVNLDGTKMKSSDSRILNCFITSSIPNYQIIRYGLNNEGKVNVIDTIGKVFADSEKWTIDNNLSDDNSLTKYLNMKSANYRNGNSFGAPYFSFTGGVTFVVPKNLSDNTIPAQRYDEQLFYVMNVADLENNVNYISDTYDLTEDYIPKAIVLYHSVNVGATVTPSLDRTPTLVYKVTDAVDDEGNMTKAVYTVQKNKYNKYFIDFSVLQTLAGDGLIPDAGDIVRLSLNNKQNIVGVIIDADYNKNIDGSTADKLDVKSNEAANYGVTSYTSFISGKVVKIGSGQIVLDIKEGPYNSGLSGMVGPVGLGGSVTYTIFNTKTGEATAATMDEVKTAYTDGEVNADFVLCSLAYYQATNVFIYTE